MKKFLFTLLLGAGCWSAQARDWYVSSGVSSGGVAAGVDDPNASNANRGTLAAPFKTIQFAADLVQPGETVYVRQGTYTNYPGSAVVLVKKPGALASSTQWITFRSYPSDAQKPLLKFNSWQGFQIKGNLSYIEINGFRIQGNNSAFNNADGTVNATAVATAANQGGSCANPTGAYDAKYNGNGISTSGDTNGNPHHLRFLNNEVFECGGAGIATGDSDYVTIDRNVVYNNCWYTVFGTSGISMNSSVNVDTNAGYHMVITHNKSFGNRLYVKWYSKGGTNPCRGITDGNGIILDTNPNYTGAFQVANNLCVANGGAGIQVFKTANVDIVNNTCYRNSRSGELRTVRGEIFLNAVTNVLVQNNVLSTNAQALPYGVVGTSSGVTFTNNLFFDADAPATTPTTGSNVVKADPLFVGASVDPNTSNFALSSSSPAINKGLNTLASGRALNYYDLAGNTRVVGSAVDLGAYELQTAAARMALATATSQPAANTGALLEAYPNPFSGAATLSYALDQAGPVRLEVVDLLGHRVALLVNETQPAGRHEAHFEAPGQANALYQVRLTTAAGTTALKLSAQP